MAQLDDLLREAELEVASFLGQTPPIQATALKPPSSFVQNQDGTASTEKTITVPADDGQYYVIPTIVQGQELAPDLAVQAWKTGKNKEVGAFKTPQEADTFAVERSRRGGKLDDLLSEADAAASAEVAGTEYHPYGALKSTALDALKGLSAIPRTLQMKETGQNMIDFYDELAEKDPDIKAFKKSAEEGKQSIWTEALGSAGPTTMAIVQRLIPFVGVPLALNYFFHLNKDEVRELALAKGADPVSAERVAWVGGAINSGLDMIGLEAFMGKLPGLQKLVKSFKHWLVGAGVRLVGSSATEAVTEGTQQLVTEIASEWAKSKDAKTFLETVNSKEWQDNAMKQAEKSFTIGAIMGGFFGGGVTMAQRALRRPAEEPGKDKTKVHGRETKPLSKGTTPVGTKTMPAEDEINQLLIDADKQAQNALGRKPVQEVESVKPVNLEVPEEPGEPSPAEMATHPTKEPKEAKKPVDVKASAEDKVEDYLLELENMKGLKGPEFVLKRKRIRQSIANLKQLIDEEEAKTNEAAKKAYDEDHEKYGLIGEEPSTQPATEGFTPSVKIKGREAKTPYMGPTAFETLKGMLTKVPGRLKKEMTAKEIDEAAKEAATSPENKLPAPTEAQKEAGNYKKVPVNVRGLPITIENPRGSTREGKDKTGKPWKRELKSHYGYIRRTEDKDGDQVDVFLGANPESDQVFVVDQVDPDTGKFDEHKAMVGFDSVDEAKKGYLENYAPGWKGLGDILPISMTGFKTWLKSGDTTKPISPALKKKPGEAEGEKAASPGQAAKPTQEVTRPQPQPEPEEKPKPAPKPELTKKEEKPYGDMVRAGNADERFKIEGRPDITGTKFEIFKHIPTAQKPETYKAVVSRETPWRTVDGYGYSPIKAFNNAVDQFMLADKPKTEEKPAPKPELKASEATADDFMAEWDRQVAEMEAAKPEPAKEAWEMTAEEATKVTGLTWDKWQDQVFAAVKGGRLAEDSPSNRSAEKTGYQDWKKLAVKAIAQPETTQVGERPQPQPTKEPWEITRGDYISAGGFQTVDQRFHLKGRAKVHNDAVKQALSEGKTVPAEVLKDYPDLKPKAQPEPAQEAEKASEGYLDASRGQFLKVDRAALGNWTFYKTDDVKDKGTRVKTKEPVYFDTEAEAERALIEYAKKNGFKAMSKEEFTQYQGEQKAEDLKIPEELKTVASEAPKYSNHILFDKAIEDGSITAATGIPKDKIRLMVYQNQLRGSSDLYKMGMAQKPEPKAKPDLMAAITSLQRPGQPRSLVSASELRDKFPDLSKEEFDSAVFDLAKQAKIALHHHDFPFSLTPEKREKMPKDDRGKYVVGVVPVEKKETPKPETKKAEEMDIFLLANLRSRLKRAQDVGAEVAGIAQAVKEYEENSTTYDLPYKETLNALNLAIAEKEQADKAEAKKDAERIEKRIEKKEAKAPEKKEEEEGEPFKKGDRVVVTLNDRTRHGTVEKAQTLFIGTVYGGAKLDQTTYYDVQTDEGAKWTSLSLKQIKAEKERPASVIPDIETREGKFKEPDDVLASYRWSMKSAKDKLAASARARKNAMKGRHQREAEKYQREANLDRIAFEKWAKENPEGLQALKDKGVKIPWETEAATPKPTVPAGTKATVPLTYHETTHAKKNIPVYVVAMGERVSRETFVALRAKASTMGGYWSRYAQQGAIPGFQFEDKAKAHEFMRSYGYEVGEKEAEPEKADTKSQAQWMQNKSLELRTQEGLSPIEALRGALESGGKGAITDQRTGRRFVYRVGEYEDTGEFAFWTSSGEGGEVRSRTEPTREAAIDAAIRDAETFRVGEAEKPQKETNGLVYKNEGPGNYAVYDHGTHIARFNTAEEAKAYIDRIANAAPTAEDKPSVTWKKAAIVPTRQGVKAVPIEEKAEETAPVFQIGDYVKPKKGSGLGPKNAGRVQHIQTHEGGVQYLKTTGTGNMHFKASDWEMSTLQKPEEQAEATAPTISFTIKASLESSNRVNFERLSYVGKLVSRQELPNGWLKLTYEKVGQKTVTPQVPTAPIDVLESPDIRWDNFVKSLTPNEQAIAGGLLVKNPKNVNAQIKAIQNSLAAPTAADKAKETADHMRKALDKFKEINKLLGEGGALSTEKIDQDLYSQIKPLLKDALAEIVAAGKSAKEFVQIALQNLSPKGRPYFEKFVREEISHDNLNADIQGERAPEVDTGRPEGQEPGDVQRTEEGGEAGGVRGGPGKGNVRDVPPGVDPGDGVRRPGQELQGKLPGTGAADQHPSARPGGKDTGNVPGILTPSTDYVIPDGGLSRQGGWKKSAKANLDAIELYKKINSENRPATEEEKAILVKYVGWGASELANHMFPGYQQNQKIYPTWADIEWRPLVERMLSLLTPEEIAPAARSTQYAHYTSEKVIRSIYRALERLGFLGGKMLEPGSGIGHFVGLLPESLRAGSTYTGIEMDPTSAGIAKLLYPNHNMQHADFTKILLPRDFFDAAIGNPPFGRIPILADPEYRKFRFRLHNYFLAKSLDRVRPGGLLVFVTSHFSMDAKSQSARSYIAKSADLVGAIRLPQTAFKANAGTEVVTDVLFLKKRVKGEEPAGEAWLNLAEVKAEDDQGVLVNEYFANHPDMVLGRHSLTGSMRGKAEYTVLPADGDIENLFGKAIENLPERVYSTVSETAENAKKKTFERDFNPKNKKEGGLYIGDDGALKIVNFGSGINVEAVHPKLKNAEKGWLRDYIPVRDALKQAHYDQLTQGNWEKSLSILQAAYKKFVEKHGRLSEYTVVSMNREDEDGNIETVLTRRYKFDKILSVDVEGANVWALEKVTEDGDIIESPILKERTILKPKETKIETIGDALAVSLDKQGRLDLDHIAELYGKDRQDIIEMLGDLIFEQPGKGFVLSDEYLAGNVVAKLEEAQNASNLDPKYRRNVEALEKVQPQPLEPRQITALPGAPWIPVEDYSKFGEEVLGLKQCEVTYHPTSNEWTIDGDFKPQGLRGGGQPFGTSDRGPNEIFKAALTQRPIKITRTDDDERTFTDHVATTAATEKLKALKKRFSSWLWMDPDRTKRLLDIYNLEYNNDVPRRFDGTHLTLPGVSSLIKLYDHQKRAIWRIIQTGNTYLAHAVGAGKTFVMIAAGMEMKRIGLISKPLYVVPSHMLGQFAREFNELYPMAHIMVADETNFHTENRRRFVAQAVMNNPDAIIVPHSSFGLFGLKPETIKPVRDAFLQQLRDAWEEMREMNEPFYLIKQAEGRLETAEQRFDSMLKSGDKAISFEEMGIDFMFLDEAHEFRKLDYVTNQRIKGIDPNGSKKAMDLYIKTLWMEKQNAGRSHVFASGTPITNTIGELYSVMRFFDPKGMEEMGIDFFDSWASMFAQSAVGYERNAAGNVQPVERFSEFVNVYDLMSRVRQFMDTLTMTQLKTRIKVPNVKGGKPETVVTKPIPELVEYQQTVLQPRLDIAKDWKPNPHEKGNPDPIINIITDGRLAGIDMRFIYPEMPNNPDSKLNAYIDGIIETYNSTKDNEYLDVDGSVSTIKGGVQICFFNNGFGENVTERRGFDARGWVMKRLKEAKIPAKDVAWIVDYKPANEKEALFKDLRSGKKRMLFGSAKMMGTGMNIQNRLYALPYLDPPWYPADVEQPLGRIIRPGNQHEEVVVKWYATEGSYDSTMWQMVARKSKSIEQALMGDRSLRRIEDISESSQYEMAAALASGDNRVIELAKAKADVQKYANLQQEWENDKHRMRKQISDVEWWYKNAKDRLKILNQMTRYISGHRKFEEGVINGRTYEKREEFNAALEEKLKADYAELKTKNEVLTATINGYRIYHVVTRRQKIQVAIEGEAAIEAAIAEEEQVKGFEWQKVREERKKEKKMRTEIQVYTSVRLRFAPDLEEAWQAHDTSATKILAFINGVDSEIDSHERKIRGYEEELNEYRKRLVIPFEFERDYHEAIAISSRLEIDLAGSAAINALGEQALSKMTEDQANENRKKLMAAFMNDLASVTGEDPIDTKLILEALIERVASPHVSSAYEQAIDVLHDHNIPVPEIADDLERVRDAYFAREAYLDYPSVIGEYPDFEATLHPKIEKAAEGEELEVLDDADVDAELMPWNESGAVYPTTKDSVEKRIRPILKKFKNAPKVTVVQKREDIPANVLRLARKKIKNGRFSGLFVRRKGQNEVYIIAESLPTAEKGVITLFHEVAHLGLRATLGEDSVEYNAFLDDVYKSKHQADVDTLAGEYGYDVGTDEGRRKASDEYFARAVGEADFSKDPWLSRMWDRFVQIVREGMKRLGFYAPITNAEIRNMMRRVYQQVTEGAQATAPVAEEAALAEQQATLASTWYSQLSRVLKTKLPNTGTLEQFLKMVEGWSQQGEFKAAELKWSGLSDWLAEQKGKITKQDVLNYLKANEVQIIEVTKGGKPYGGLEVFKDDDGRFHVLDGDIDLGDRQGYETEIEANLAADEIEMALKEPEGGGTKHHKWQIPGGEKYRELLLTLPVKEEKFYVPGYGWEKDLHKESRQSFTSSHWSEPNVLAHVRFNDRFEPRAILFIEEIQSDEEPRAFNRILFIEEIQSDWHQEGRKKGYNTGQLNEADKAFAEYEKQLEEKYGGRPARGNLTWAEGQKWDELFYKSSASGLSKKGVPSAPFAKTWHELVLKRMLRYAAENGYDRVAWTTGEQQAERYDLSKQVDSVTIGVLDSGYFVQAKKNGEKLITKNRLTPTSLEETIGKDLAKKAIEDLEIEKENIGKIGKHGISIKTAQKTYSGLDLKVGGEGMKGFYDKMLPAFLNKYGKKWGAKVEDISLTTGEDLDTQRRRRQEHEQLESETGTFQNLENIPIKKKITVHSIPVTDAMRESVLYEGQVMFAKDVLAPLKGLSKVWKSKRTNWRDQKPDTNVLDRIISIPSHFFHKVDALQRMFTEGLNRADTYYEIQEAIIKGPEGKFYTETLESFNRKEPKEYEKFKNYLVDRDRNQIGYKVIMKDEKTFLLFNPRRQRVGEFDSEVKAWAKAIAEELKDFRKSGASDMAVDSLLAARMITHQGFEVLMSGMRNAVKTFQASGQVPSVKVDIDNKIVEVNLYEELRRMGDMRGYYFPRIRRSGRLMLTAMKEGTNSVMEFFDLGMKNPPQEFSQWRNVFNAVTPIGQRARELERQGYSVKIDLSKKMPEDVFELAGSLVATQALINQALERIHGKGLTLDDFGLKFINRMVSPAGVRDFALTGPTPKAMSPIFKDLGGKFYSAYAGEMRMWHFINPGANFERRLAKALANTGKIVDLETETLFAKAFVEQFVNIVKGRGYLSHKIKRRMDKGEEVRIGYEEDPLIALSKYARGLAAGEAKRIMAFNMVKDFTGTDISWEQFKMDNGFDVEYEDYLDFVAERRIDPVKQPNAFKEGKVYMEDMLRNEEWMDRAIGTIKGVAVLKYLGFRPSAPLINLTALATSVPATMSAYGKIPLHQTFRLLGQAFNLYRQYRWGDRKAMKPDEARIFDDIAKRGWDKPQYNQEALAVLEGKLGRGWNKVINASMFAFGVTEQINRAATIAGTYIGIKRLDPGMPHEDILKQAKHASDRAHGIYRKANFPHYARGGHIAAQVARMFYVFRTFSHTYLMTMKELGFKNPKASAYMLLSPAILAGTGATIATPILKAMMQAFGLGGDDPEEEFYAWLDENLGEHFERFGRHGAFGLLGANLKGSLQIAMTDVPTNLKDVLGAPGSVMSDVSYGIQSLARGDTLKGVEKLLPNFAANVSRAYREKTEGLTTRTNTPVFFGNDRVIPTTLEAFYRALSFNPARLATIREKQRSEKMAERGYTDLRSDIYAKFKRFVLKPEAERSQADYIDLLAEVAEYNERARDKGGAIPLITEQSIRTNVKRALVAPKAERMRAMD